MQLNKLLDIDYPFIQGAMAHIATGEFAAAVSNAGALGIIGSGGMNADRLEIEIKKAKSLTDRPFGVNVLMLHRQIDEIAQLVRDYKIPVITTGAGNPGSYIKMWQEVKSKVIPVVSVPSLAKRMERLGADAIISEGQEAGGHIGQLSTMTLLPQVRKSVNIPVIAAGGIASKEQLLAAKVLGACGAQIGTRLLLSEECPVHQKYKEKIKAAKSSQITVIGRIGALPTRVLKNNMTRNYSLAEKSGADWESLEKYTLNALKRAVKEGDVENGSVMCGEVVGMVNEIKSLKTIFKELYEGYLEERNNLCQYLSETNI